MFEKMDRSRVNRYSIQLDNFEILVLGILNRASKMYEN